jgi:hypothetical protein
MSQNDFYKGQWKEFRKHGEGEDHLPNGDIYIG